MKSAKHFFTAVLLVVGISACNQNQDVETINGEEETEMNSERGDTSTDIDQGGSTGIETEGRENGARHEIGQD